MNEWFDVRDEFPILSRHTYLNSCSLGALSRRAEHYLGDFTERWHDMGASAWYGHWLGRIEELRGRVAAFLGADPKSLALLRSAARSRKAWSPICSSGTRAAPNIRRAVS